MESTYLQIQKILNFLTYQNAVCKNHWFSILEKIELY